MCNKKLCHCFICIAAYSCSIVDTSSVFCPPFRSLGHEWIRRVAAAVSFQDLRGLHRVCSPRRVGVFVVVYFGAWEVYPGDFRTWKVSFCEKKLHHFLALFVAMHSWKLLYVACCCNFCLDGSWKYRSYYPTPCLDQSARVLTDAHGSALRIQVEDGLKCCSWICFFLVMLSRDRSARYGLFVFNACIAIREKLAANDESNHLVILLQSKRIETLVIGIATIDSRSQRTPGRCRTRRVGWSTIINQLSLAYIKSTPYAALVFTW